MALNLVKYTNESYQKIKVIYDNCVMNFIDEEKFELVSDRKKKESTPPVRNHIPLAITVPVVYV
jgi:hypothetical protein